MNRAGAGTSTDQVRPSGTGRVHRFRGWSRDLRGTAFWFWFLLILLAQVGLRLWNSLPMSYYQDDWQFGYEAIEASVGWLFQAENGYWAPLARAVVWIVMQLAPFNYVAAMLAVTGMMAVTSLAVLFLLREFFGRTPLTLVLTLAFSITPLFLVTNAWWTVGVSVVPAIGLFAVAWIAQCHWIRNRRPLWLGLGILALVGSLLFTQKSILVVGFLIAWIVLVEYADIPGLRARIQTGGAWLIALCGLAVVYSIGYVLSSSSNLKNDDPLGALWSTFQNSVGSVALPAVFGGPWASEGGAFPVFAAPSAAQLIALLVLLAAVAIFLIRFGSGGARFLIPIGLFAIANLVLLTMRGGELVFGASVLRQGRYWVDLVLPVLVTLGVMWRGRRCLPGARPAARVRKTASTLHRQTRQLIGAAAALAVVLSSWLAWTSITPGMHTESGEPWLSNLTRSLADNPQATIADSPMPSSLIDSYIFPDYGRISQSLRFWVTDQKFDVPSPEYLVVDESGTLQPAKLAISSSSMPGPQPGCGYLATDQPARIPILPFTYPWNWAVQINYAAKQETEITISIEDQTFTYTVAAGLGRVIFRHVGKVDEVTVATASSESPVCIDTVGVGNLVTVSTPT